MRGKRVNEWTVSAACTTLGTRVKTPMRLVPIYRTATDDNSAALRSRERLVLIMH